MLVDLKCGADGEECWNADVIQVYADGVNAKEARLAESPDIAVNSGGVACQGCIVNENGLGTICSAELTETQFSIVGERVPGSDDAYAPSTSIPGLKLVKPGSGSMAEGYALPEDDSARTTVLITE